MNNRLEERKTINLILILFIGFYLVDLFFYWERLLISTGLVYTSNIVLLLAIFFTKGNIFKKILILESIIWTLHLLMVKDYGFWFETGLSTSSYWHIHWKAVIFDVINLVFRSIVISRIVLQVSIVKVIIFTILLVFFFLISFNSVYAW
jgi:hypothetical protein